MSENKENKPAEVLTSGKPAAAPNVQQLASALEQHDEIEKKIESLIRPKIAAGLDRDQAIQVVKAQVAHDAALEAAQKKAKA